MPDPAHTTSHTAPMPLTPWRYAGGGQISDRDGEPVAFLSVRLHAYDSNAIGCLIAQAWLIPELSAVLRGIIARADDENRHPSDDQYDKARAVLAKLDAQP